MQRIRIYYAKTQALRYTGNLDVHKIWERTLRRANLPLAYSQGFHPQPRLNQACPLPLGMLSRAEIIDIWLDPDLPLEQVEQRLASHTQPGIEIDHYENIDLHEPALQTRVAASRYRVTLLALPGESPIGQPELSEKVAGLLSAESLPRERRDETLRSAPLYPKPGNPPSRRKRPAGPIDAAFRHRWRFRASRGGPVSHGVRSIFRPNRTHRIGVFKVKIYLEPKNKEITFYIQKTYDFLNIKSGSFRFFGRILNEYFIDGKSCNQCYPDHQPAER